MYLLPDMMARQEVLFYSQESNHLHQQPRAESQISLLLGTVLCCNRKSAGKAGFASWTYAAMLYLPLCNGCLLLLNIK
jgi:hypothetical protein